MTILWPKILDIEETPHYAVFFFDRIVVFCYNFGIKMYGAVMEQFRLDKLVCDIFKVSRKQAKTDILAGNITVNGEVALKSSEHFFVTDKIERLGVLGKYQKYVYIMMNKPVGVLSATKDRHTKTVIDLLPTEMRHRDLFVAGRLDKNTTGFLLITNDGDFAHNILSPKKHVVKTYLAELRDIIAPEAVEQFACGIKLSDFTCKPAQLEILDLRLVKIKITEGKFHQIKRMFAAIGNEVMALHRCGIGGLHLDDSLEPGQARYITELEFELLKGGNYNG